MLTPRTVGKIDEAHGYKNLRTPSNIADAAIDGSMRASDLDMKIDYLRRRNGRRVVTFATATPIANSVTEAYVMQRYLRPDLLEAAGIEVFDTWAATFGQVVSQVELAPEGGSSFRMKSRFARFANVPEMLRMFHVAADVKTGEDLALPVPQLRQHPGGKRAAQTVTVEPSQELLGYVRDLGERAARVRNRAVGPEEDNMLKISGDGRRAALDLRLLGLPQATPGKITAAADRIAATWKQHQGDEYTDPGGTPYPVRGSLQLVFCDLGTPGTGWNAYDELRSQLTARGVPQEAIRFIHDAKTDRDKAQLFAACRSGRVGVLIGSTEKMGVGTNVQDRAIALHHLDAPWRPADVAQREGRILRQGNLNPEVEIIRYVAERSFDGYMWQTLERKARFIGQVMHGRLDTREISDIGDTALSFSEVKAIATGNPLLLDKAEADAALARLQRAERAHHRNQQALLHAIADYEADITRLTTFAAAVDAAIARRQDTRAGKFAMTIGSTRYDKRADAGQRIRDILQREAAALTGQLQRSVNVGQFAGFALTASLRRSQAATEAAITLEGAPGCTIELPASAVPGTDPAGLVTRLEHRLTHLETRKARAIADTEHAHRQITHARSTIGQPFPHGKELAAARDRVRQIDDTLNQMAQQQPSPADAAGHEPGGGEDNQGPGSGRPPAQPDREAPSQGGGGNPGIAIRPLTAPATGEHNGVPTPVPGRRIAPEPAPQAEPGSPVGEFSQEERSAASGRQATGRAADITPIPVPAEAPGAPPGPTLAAYRPPAPAEKSGHVCPAPGGNPGAGATPQAPGRPSRAEDHQAASTQSGGRAREAARPEPGRSEPAPDMPAAPSPESRPGLPITTQHSDTDADASGHAARWPAPNHHTQVQTANPAPRSTARDGGNRSPAAAANGPSADWRDDILRAARDPQQQPAASWPGYSALYQAPSTGNPDAGIEPGR